MDSLQVARRIAHRLRMSAAPETLEGIRKLVIKEAQGASRRVDEVEAAVMATLTGGGKKPLVNVLPPARDAKDEEHAVEEEVEKEVFERYKQHLGGITFAGNPSLVPAPHPGDIAESGLLASVRLPRLEYCTGALEGCVEKRALSDLQLEGALHACRRHTVLRGEVRSGFFLGDGAGVGKGRQIAAVILDNVARGRLKHLWFSIASDLRLDAERDLEDVGCHNVGVIDGCQSLDSLSKLAFGSGAGKRGVVFSTYSTLISTVSSKGGRLDQLVNWCGGPEDFQGCVIFDEAHKAKNFSPGATDSAASSSTKVALAVIALQERLPRARVVYASATGVTEIGNLAYASRLGLWGAGTAFETFKDFYETMENRGAGALELLAIELKTSGAYVSRGLSWSKCEFEHKKCQLDAAARGRYDAFAAWWRALRRCLSGALKMANSSKTRAWTTFYGTQLRVFKEMQTASKVPFVVEAAKAALERGECVVIGLQSTGESGLEAMMLEQGKRPGDCLSSQVSAAKYASRKLVLDLFPTVKEQDMRQTTTVPSDAMIVQLLQCEGKPPPTAADVARHREFCIKKGEEHEEVIPELVALKREILESLDALQVPPSPLDSLIEALGGPSCVAEMTGRSSRIVRSARDPTKLRYELRAAPSQGDSLNVRERKLFMEGKKRVAIISDAASTGISLHAALSAPSSHLRRNHITLELAWSADKTIQQLGRSHRANQASAPLYCLLTTDLAGEARFGAAVAKRLSSLGALTKGDRRAASGQDMSQFEVDTKHGRQALTLLAGCCTNRFEEKVALGLEVQGSLLVALEEATAERLDPPTFGSSFLARFQLMEEDDDSRDSSEQERLDWRRSIEPSISENTDQLRLARVARRCYADLQLSDPKKQGDVKAFLNRLQSLSFASQTLLYEYFMACLRSVVAEAKANGTLDAGVADLRASSATVDSTEVVGVDAVSGAQTDLYAITLDRGVTHEKAVEKLQTALSLYHDDTTTPEKKKRESTSDGFRGTGWYISRRRLPATNRHGLLLAVQKGNKRYYVATRPSTGTSPYEMNRLDLHDTYVAHAASWRGDDDDFADLEKEWTQQYEDADTTGRGGRRMRLGLVSGAVLPFWKSLDKTVKQYRSEMTKAEQALKVCRVVLSDGSKLIGIRFPMTVLEPLKANLKAELAERAAYARSCVVTERPTPIDTAALKLASTAPRKITSFFTKSAHNTNKQGGPTAVVKAVKQQQQQKRTSPTAAPVVKQQQLKRTSPAAAAPKPKKRASNGPSTSDFFTAKKSKPEPSTSDFFTAKKSKKTELKRASSASSSSASSSAASEAYSECPVCGNFIESKEINTHLDNCLKTIP